MSCQALTKSCRKLTMSSHVLNEGVRDPAIKLFGTTIAVPLGLMRSGDGVSDTRPGSPQKLSAVREGILSAVKLEIENDLKVVNAEASAAILKQTHVQQSMEPSTSKCLQGVEGSLTDNIAPLPLRKKKQVLDTQCVVESQETSCRRPGRAVACPRCESRDTKFCYYNNYNVNQPRHFCKNCQRYWTAGGTLRNVPVGAGRRKNKNGLSTMQRHFVLEDGPVRADAPDAALPCNQLSAIGGKASVLSSELYKQCAKQLEVFPSKAATASENAVPIAGEVIREFGSGKHVCTDDDFALQWKSRLDSASNPRPGPTCVPTVRCNSTFSAHPSAISDWTSMSRFCGAWPHGYTVDWSRDMSGLGGKLVPRSPTQLIGVPSIGCQERSESMGQGTWGTVHWLNVWCVPEWPVRRASNCHPLAMSSLGKHLRDVTSAESREGGGLWAPKVHKTEDLGSCCQSFMGSTPKLGREPQTSSALMGFQRKILTKDFLEDGLTGKTRHANPAAMTRSMVFQEFN